jgi:hypothetical protein
MLCRALSDVDNRFLPRILGQKEIGINEEKSQSPPSNQLTLFTELGQFLDTYDLPSRCRGLNLEVEDHHGIAAAQRQPRRIYPLLQKVINAYFKRVLPGVTIDEKSALA